MELSLHISLHIKTTITSTSPPAPQDRPRCADVHTYQPLTHQAFLSSNDAGPGPGLGLGPGQGPARKPSREAGIPALPPFPHPLTQPDAPLHNAIYSVLA